jgi:uncharacterized OsmC-like protein
MPADTDRIRTTFERSIKAISLRPTVGRKTAVSRTRLADGLECEVEEGRWRLVSDLSEKGGGSGSGPDSGVLGRAALGTCLAMGVKMWAAYRGVPVAAVEVEVETDFDAGAQYGVGDSPPGFTEVRYSIRVESGASESDVAAVIEEAERCSPWLDVFSRGQTMRRNVTITAPQE